MVLSPSRLRAAAIFRSILSYSKSLRSAQYYAMQGEFTFRVRSACKVSSFGGLEELVAAMVAENVPSLGK